jgi:putative hydrolase of the HAD superfamily
MSGASELIFELDSMGVHLGVISNGGQASREKTLASTSFGHLFKQVVSSEQFGVAKPNGSIFIDTAKAAGFSPSECLYIGDHPVNDIQAANRIGMDVIWLLGFHADTGLPEGVIKVASYKEISKLLTGY